MTDEPAERWEGLEAEALRERWALPRLAIFRRVGSTNDVARRMAADGAPAGTVVLAEEQVAGRGRVGRRWASPPGLGLWLSSLAGGAEAGSALPLRVGLAVAEALDAFLPGPCGLKWPNDLVFAGRKLGGILCEGSWDAAGPGAVVIGVGVNVLHEPAHFPAEVSARAASVRQLAERPVERLAVADRVIPAVARLARGAGEPAGSLAERVAARDPLRGREVEVREPSTGALVAAGTADGVSPDGALRVLAADGLVLVRSGSVALPADPAAAG